MAADLLRSYCRELKLGTVPGVYDQFEFQDRERYLTAVFGAELQARRENRIKKLLKRAAFISIKTLEDFDFQTVTLPETTSIAALTELAFLQKRENVLMLGAVGTGKTHLATALGVKACMQGTSVRFFRAVDLVNTLLEKHKNGILARYMRELRQCELLILDEVGFVPFHRDGAELLFNVIADCYERCSVIVTSNLEFGQWTTVFGDSRLTACSNRSVGASYNTPNDGVLHRCIMSPEPPRRRGYLCPHAGWQALGRRPSFRETLELKPELFFRLASLYINWPPFSVFLSCRKQQAA